MTPRPARHVFVDSGIRDQHGTETCAACPLPRPNDIHHMPEQPVEQTAYEQRRTGERQ